MSARDEILGAGWSQLTAGKNWLSLYRWKDGKRVELHIMFDPIGRVEAWSEWHNQRVISPDQQPGRRARLMARMEELAPHAPVRPEPSRPDPSLTERTPR